LAEAQANAQELALESLQTPSMLARILTLFSSLALLCALLVSFQAEKMVVFGANGRLEAEVLSQQGVPYVDLGGVLAAEGQVGLKRVRNGLQFRVSGVDIEVHQDDRELRANGKTIRLDAPATAGTKQSFIPVANVAEVLRALLKKPAILRPGNRLIIGNTADYIATEYKPGDPTSLVLNFQNPVNPSINTEEGKVSLVFRNDPVVMNTPEVQYQDKAIKRLEFAESAGAAEVVVTGTGALTARFEDGNRRIVITPAAQVATAPATPPPAPEQVPASASPEGQQPPATGEPATVPAEEQKTAPTNRVAVVAIDPAHGGNDNGVRFSEKLLEKTISMAIAEKLRAELSNRGISSILLRDGDQDVSGDDRAQTANVARVSYYVSIHAGQGGTGARVYTPIPTPTVTRSLFQSWDNVQSSYADRSVVLAAGMTSQIAQKKIPVRQLAANTSPLAHVAAASVVVEVAPEDEDEEDSLTSPQYQQKIAQAIAMSIAEARSKQ
jgi:N-acetylmuramoyl-L-alanine amidase